MDIHDFIDTSVYDNARQTNDSARQPTVHQEEIFFGFNPNNTIISSEECGVCLSSDGDGDDKCIKYSCRCCAGICCIKCIKRMLKFKPLVCGVSEIYIKCPYCRSIGLYNETNPDFERMVGRNWLYEKWRNHKKDIMNNIDINDFVPIMLRHTTDTFNNDNFEERCINNTDRHNLLRVMIHDEPIVDNSVRLYEPNDDVIFRGNPRSIENTIRNLNHNILDTNDSENDSESDGESDGENNNDGGERYWWIGDDLYTMNAGDDTEYLVNDAGIEMEISRQMGILYESENPLIDITKECMMEYHMNDTNDENYSLTGNIIENCSRLINVEAYADGIIYEINIEDIDGGNNNTIFKHKLRLVIDKINTIQLNDRDVEVYCKYYIQKPYYQSPTNYSVKDAEHLIIKVEDNSPNYMKYLYTLTKFLMSEIRDENIIDEYEYETDSIELEMLKHRHILIEKNTGRVNTIYNNTLKYRDEYHTSLDDKFKLADGYAGFSRIKQLYMGTNLIIDIDITNMDYFVERMTELIKTTPSIWIEICKYDPIHKCGIMEIVCEDVSNQWDRQLYKITELMMDYLEDV